MVRRPAPPIPPLGIFNTVNFYLTDYARTWTARGSPATAIKGERYRATSANAAHNVTAAAPDQVGSRKKNDIFTPQPMTSLPLNRRLCVDCLPLTNGKTDAPNNMGDEIGQVALVITATCCLGFPERGSKIW